jgi:predicted Co/Zn/Cd cation transporter (cation efflux family)
VSAPVRPANRSLTAIDGAIALIAVLLIVQMWLLTATLEAFLAGHHEAALPAAIVSAVLFAGCFALYLFIDRADRASRHPPG